MSRRGRLASRCRRAWSVAALIVAVAASIPRPAAAHPMGNFSINHYAAIAVAPRQVELRYLIDMAEIPTFQEMRERGFAADPAEMARQYGAGTSVLDWRDRLVCSRCGSRAIDMVVTGTERR